MTPKSNRRCSNCGSDKTGKTYHKYDRWYHIQNGLLCSKCYDILIRNPRTVPRMLSFRNRTVVLSEVPRTGKCSWCGKSIGDEYINCFGKKAIIKETHIHHFAEYHPEDVLKDTVEVCASCHAKESNRIRRL